MKEQDSFEKQVTHCDLCDKWFCEKHREPKFPFFVDWDTVLDVQGNPEIKALFHTEYERKGGHPDFAYWRKTFEALDIEEEIRNKLIRLAIESMVEADKDRIDLTIEKTPKRQYENNFGRIYTVPIEVYKDKVCREKLHNANSSSQVESIVRNYYKYGSSTQDYSKKKQHWWNKS